MVRVDGIEPTTSAWKADVLPLNYTRIIEGRTMPTPPPMGQDRNSEKLAFFTTMNAPRPLTDSNTVEDHLKALFFGEWDRCIHRFFFDKILQN